MVEIHLAYLQPDQDTLGAYLVRQHQGNHLDRLVYNSCQMQISDHKLESELAYQSYLGDNQVVHTFLVQVPSYLKGKYLSAGRSKENYGFLRSLIFMSPFFTKKNYQLHTRGMNIQYLFTIFFLVGGGG